MILHGLQMAILFSVSPSFIIASRNSYGPVRQQNSGWFSWEPKLHRLTALALTQAQPVGVTFDDWGQHGTSYPIFASAHHALDPPTCNIPDQVVSKLILVYAVRNSSIFKLAQELQGMMVKFVTSQPTAWNFLNGKMNMAMKKNTYQISFFLRISALSPSILDTVREEECVCAGTIW